MCVYVCVFSHVFLILKLFKQIKGVCERWLGSRTGGFTETLRLAHDAPTSISLQALCCFLPLCLCTYRSLYLQCLAISFILTNLTQLRPRLLQGALPTPAQAQLG